MRDMTTPLFKDLLARGNETVSITPGSTAQLATFEITGLPPVTAGMKNYADAFHLGVTLTFDPDAAGNAVSADKLYKGVSSHRLYSQWLGDVYPHQQTRGAVSALVINPIANGAQMSQHARIQIPASTDADVTLELYYPAPLAHECLKKPYELSQWIGFFDGGTVEAMIADTAVYDGDYAGAVIKSPVTVRAFVEYHPSPDESLGVPFQWRERQIVGGGNQPLLKGVGQETNLLGVDQGCGLAGLFWLTDATGMGLSGPDGVDNIVSIEIPWRGQTQLRNLDGYWLAFRRAMGRRVGPISGLGTTIMHDGAGYPTTMDATPNGRYSANAQQLFLPIVFPGMDFETSKAQRLGGDLPINFTFTAAVTNTHRFVSWELMEFDNNQIARLGAAMGHAGKTPVRKGFGGLPVSEGDGRFTRWHFK